MNKRDKNHKVAKRLEGAKIIGIMFVFGAGIVGLTWGFYTFIAALLLNKMMITVMFFIIMLLAIYGINTTISNLKNRRRRR